MRKLWFFSAALFLGAVTVSAAPQPATPGTLQDYINTGADGVLNAGVRFFDFQVFSFLDPSISPIAPTAVAVVPFAQGSAPGFDFLFGGNANSGELAGLKFAFNVEHPTLGGAELSLIDPGATEDGNATALADLTLGSPYDPSNGGVSGGLTELIAFHMVGLSDPAVNVNFAPVSQLGVGAEFVVDGGLDGSAQLRGVRVLFRVPDQASALSFALALMALALTRTFSKSVTKEA